MSSEMERSKKVKVKNGIEDLTDDLLILILSKMSLVEAARTSVLSHRWKDLWKFGTCLDFDASTVLSREVLDESEAWYVAWVNKVTESRKDEKFKVEDFRIHFWLGSHHEDDLKEWIGFAITKEVTIFDLNLSGYTPIIFELQQGCKLSVEECCRALSELVNLRSLTTLKLRSVNLTKQLIESILSSCLILRHFSIVFGGNVADLNVLSSGLKLLQIVNSGGNVFTEIRAPKLAMLVFVGQVFQPQIVDLPKLVTLSICVIEPLSILGVLKPFGTQLPLLLHLEVRLNEVKLLNLEHIPKFLNLKILSIRFKRINDNCCRSFILLLNACPSLEVLRIGFGREYPPTDDSDELLGSKLKQKGVVKCLRLEHLKKIEFVIFNGDVFDWEVIKDTIGNSPNLQKVFINTSFLKSSLGSSPNRSLIVNTVKKNAINLRSKLPIGARLIFS